MAALRLLEVRERVAAAAARAGPAGGEVTLVAVSKGVPAALLAEAYALGQRDFGENRAGALAGRLGELPADARWHFIGRLQGNKVRLVRPVACLLHSLDRLDLAGYWAAGAEAPPPALVQVNVAGEPGKAGVPPGEAERLVAAATGLGIEVRGLMMIPPVARDPEEARPHFRALRDVRAALRPRWPLLGELSMGMSDDFEVAVEEGATRLRVGRAIFGPFPESGERG
jgi:pyridoxal phosphate enzyme (YggS family)